jgi:hypothetical protein
MDAVMRWSEVTLPSAIGTLRSWRISTRLPAGRGLRIEADTDPDNAASIHLLERFGFRREGIARERYRLDMGELGQTQDSLLLGLLKHEFMPLG